MTANTFSPTIETTQAVAEMPIQAKDNIEALVQAGELGVYFSQLYTTALHQAPELAEVVITPSDKSKDPILAHTDGMARHQGFSDSHKPELKVNTGDGWDHYSKLMESRPISTRVSAEKAGIRTGNISAQDLAGFIFLHELGHAKNYLNEATDFDAYTTQRQEEMSKLPIPGYNPVQLMNFLATEAGQKYMSTNREVLRARGINTPEDLVYLQEAAYHDMPSEDNPDQFAATVLARHKSSQGGA